jgi:hypothetical protein
VLGIVLSAAMCRAPLVALSHMLTQHKIPAGNLKQLQALDGVVEFLHERKA